MVYDAGINVLAGLGTANWSGSQAIAYETGLEAVRQAIGYYADLIAKEEAATEPDAAAIEVWRAEQRAWAARGQELTPLDTRAIKRIRADADDLLSIEDDDDDDEDSDADDTDDEDEDGVGDDRE